jgi:hypothetical protein
MGASAGRVWADGRLREFAQSEGLNRHFCPPGATLLSLVSGGYSVGRIRGLWLPTPNAEPPLERDAMDSAGVSDERGSRSVAERAALDWRGRRPHPGTVRPGPAHAHQISARPAVDVDPATADSDTADLRQADYFLRLLSQNRRLVEHRIDGYRKAIAGAEASGNTEGAANLRRLGRVEELERETLTGLIEKLRRRFPARSAPDVPGLPRRSRLAVR